MTMASITQARDELQAIILPLSRAPHNLTVVWDDVAQGKPNEDWARVIVKHELGGQANLAAESRRRYRSRGTMWVQLFTVPGKGLSRSDALTKVVQDLMRGATTPGGAWLRRCRVNEIGISGKHYQVNVLADFEYDEIK